MNTFDAMTAVALLKRAGYKSTVTEQGHVQVLDPVYRVQGKNLVHIEDKIVTLHSMTAVTLFIDERC